MRKTALLPLVALLAAALPALAFERVEIRTKDVVLGTITANQSTHEYLVDVPRDAVFSMSLPRQKESRLQGSMGIFDTAYRGQRLLLIGRRKIQLDPPPRASTRLRAIVQGVNESVGDYVLKPKLKVRKKYKIRGKRSDLSPPGQITFGALPGYDVELKVTWAGPDPVTIGSFTGPDGGDLVSELPAKQKKRSFKQKGFRTTQFGDHTVVLDIPPSANRWTLQVVQKGKDEGRTLELRESHVEAPELELGVGAGPLPLITVLGEDGAGNELLMTATGFSPSIIDVRGGEAEDCELVALEPGGTPRFYGFSCGETHEALFTIDERNEGRYVLGMTADPVITPGGTGAVVFPVLERDAANRLLGWTEVRTFDASGNEHTLRVTDIQRTGDIYTYTVLHTRPDGTQRRYDFLPFE